MFTNSIAEFTRMWSINIIHSYYSVSGSLSGNSYQRNSYNIRVSLLATYNLFGFRESNQEFTDKIVFIPHGLDQSWIRTPIKSGARQMPIK